MKVQLKEEALSVAPDLGWRALFEAIYSCWHCWSDLILFNCLSICLFDHLFISLPPYPSFKLLINLFTHYPIIHSFIYSSVSFVHLSVHLFTHMLCGANSARRLFTIGWILAKELLSVIARVKKKVLKANTSLSE